jgi:hypothetical protein
MRYSDMMWWDIVDVGTVKSFFAEQCVNQRKVLLERNGI